MNWIFSNGRDVLMLCYTMFHWCDVVLMLWCHDVMHQCCDALMLWWLYQQLPPTVSVLWVKWNCDFVIPCSHDTLISWCTEVVMSWWPNFNILKCHPLKTIYQYYEQTINKIRIRIKMIQIQNTGCRDSGKKWTLLGLEEGRTITPHFPSASEVRGKWQRMPNWSLYSKATRQQKGKRRPRDPWYTATGKMES